MTDTDRALITSVERLLAKWVPRLHLQDWAIKVRLGDVDECDAASVCVAWRDKLVVLRLPSDYYARIRRAIVFLADEPDEDVLEHSVVHELLHITEYPLARQFEKMLEDWIGRDGGVVTDTWDNWRDSREIWVNAVARTLIEADRGAWSTPTDRHGDPPSCGACGRPFPAVPGLAHEECAGRIYDETVGLSREHALLVIMRHLCEVVCFAGRR